MSTTIDKCREIGLPIIEEMGYTLVDLEFVKEGRNYVLRYLVDAPGGINIDDCALISEQISRALDENDPIPQEYMLEIASPGAEKPLKTKEEVKASVGKYVNVKLYAPIDGLKEFEGDLVSFDDDVIVLEYKDKTIKKKVEIKFDLVAKIRLAIKF